MAIESAKSGVSKIFSLFLHTYYPILSSMIRSSYLSYNLSLTLSSSPFLHNSVWMLHCHILQHMIMGMQTAWIMGNASQITRGTSPDLVAGYLTFGGAAYGNASYDPLVNHYFDDD